MNLRIPVAALLLASCAATPPVPDPSPAVPPPYDPASATATIRVRTTAKGTLPRMRPIQFDADPFCAQEHKEEVLRETIVATDGKLANVIAWVSKGGDQWVHSVPEAPARLDIRGCMFQPHVLTFQVGQALMVQNHDRTHHNAHGIPKAAEEFNKPVPPQGQPVRFLLREEMVGCLVKDDCYSWMDCRIGVLPHPFHGVTDREGTLVLRVPPGEYEVSVWHEFPKFAQPEPRAVTLGAGETREIEFVFEIL